MTKHRELVLDDFRAIEMPNGESYLSTTVGKYEITIEPHLVTGYSIGIYRDNEMLALEKRGAWLRNHPAKPVPPQIPSKVLERALNYANQLLQKYL